MTHAHFSISPPYEAFYIQAMLFNSRAAIASIERVSEVLEKLADGNSGKSLEALNNEELLNDLQNVVIHGAACPVISGLLEEVTRRGPSF